jgi:hypothetical protein
VVDRVIEHLAPPPPPLEPAEGHANGTPRNIDEWVAHLEQVAKALDTGRIYVRDLAQLRPAIENVMEAYDRRAPRR